MYIRQISIFLENRSGTLAEVTDFLYQHGVNLRALSIADTAEFGILRIIVSDSDRIASLLGDRYLISRTEVVAARMDDHSGALCPILKVLNEANINIEYMYAFTGSGPEEAYVVFRVNDVQTAEEVLAANGIETLTDTDLQL